MPVSKALVESVERRDFGEPVPGPFNKDSMLAIIKHGTVTMLEISDEIRLSDKQIYSLDRENASLLYGMFLALRLENGCER